MADPTPTLGRTVKGLPRYYMDCGWWRHPRFAGLPIESLFVFQAIVSYSTEHATDGEVPGDIEDLAIAVGLKASILRRALPPLEDRKVLTRSGGVASVRNWAEHNPTSAEMDAYREAKSRKGTLGNHTRWHVARGRFEPTCEHCIADRDPSLQRSPSDSPGDRSSDPTGRVGDELGIDRGSIGDHIRIGSGIENERENPTSDSGAPGRKRRSTRANAPDADRSSDPPGSPRTIPNRSHGMGWDGNPSSSPPIDSRPEPPTVAGAGAPTDEDQPRTPTAVVDAAISHMALCDEKLHLATGGTIRNRTAWLKTAQTNRRQQHQAELERRATDHPGIDPVALAEQLDERCGPLDGGTARSDQAWAQTKAEHDTDRAHQAEERRLRHAIDTHIEQLSPTDRTALEARTDATLDGNPLATNRAVRLETMRNLIAQEHPDL